MSKQEILRRLELSREHFLDLIDPLDDAMIERPGVVGDWSIKDIMIHLSRWEAELVKLLWQIRLEQPPSSLQVQRGIDVDAQNEVWHQESHSRPLEHVLDDFHAVRNQTLLRVEAFSEKELTNPQQYASLKGRSLEDYIASDTYDHEAEHGGEISIWLSNLGK